MEMIKRHPAPHIKSPDSVSAVMTDVLISLLPAAVWAVYAYGARTLSIMLVSVVSAILTETVFEFFSKKSYTILDLSAVITGLLIAFSLPVTVPLYIPAAASIFAIGIVKCVFGGLGGNFLNPALSGILFVKLLFSGVFEKMIYIKPFSDIVTSATPLSELKSGAIPSFSIYDRLLGNAPGALGEGAVLLLLAGGIYLLVRGIISWHIPFAYIGSVAVLTIVFPQNVSGIMFMISHLISGGLMLGAFYMATDPVTSPMTSVGKLIYGIICGGMTVLLRYYGAGAEGVCAAILFANLLSGIIDKMTFPKRFGGVPVKKDGKAVKPQDERAVSEGEE